MKDNKKIVMPTIIGVIFVILVLGGYWFLNRQDKNTTLTLLEKQWIETNKNKVFDFALLSDVPVFNMNGEGIVFDFLNSLEDATTMEFNKVSYTLGSEIKADYAFKIANKKASSDLLVYQDHFVLLTKEAIKYQDQSTIKDLVIGVLDDDLDSVNKYLSNGQDLTYKTYNSVTSLIAAINSEVTAIVLPRTKYLQDIISNPNLHIAYDLVEMTQDYVITLGDNAKLNTIVTKYFRKWYKDNYTNSYDTHLTKNYITFKGIDDKTNVKFRSKRYAYGFINNMPYESKYSGEYGGMNVSLIANFAHLANIEISLNQYNSVGALLADFNANKVDFFYGINSPVSYKMDIVSSVAPFNNKVMVISPLETDLIVNSLKTLEGKEVAVLKGSKIASTLKSSGAKLKEYNTVSEVINAKRVMAIDYYTYHYYASTVLKNYNIDYEFMMANNVFIGRDIKANEVFNDYFDFYVSFADAREVVDATYSKLYASQKNNSLVGSLFNVLGYVALILVIVYESYKVLISKKKKKETILSKSDKLKYIDMLTSLKNRNYLNDNIEKWDNSDVYPQTIIIADLNNVAYINDNYGYQEGDKVIREAANILINNQLENTDIIRTNGNEFLIYMVGHDEKQVVAYIRKLNKEFKELSHGFGAATGYSLINDAIKTVDDAINEATLDMRTNKEVETNNE